MSNVRDTTKRDNGFLLRKTLWLEQIDNDRGVTSAAFQLAFQIGRFINSKTGQAWPALETLAKSLAVDVRSIRRLIRLLERRGHLLVTIQRGRGRTNIFAMVHKTGHGGPLLTSENRTPVSLKPDSGVHKTGLRSPPNSLKEPKEELLGRSLARANGRAPLAAIEKARLAWEEAKAAEVAARGTKNYRAAQDRSVAAYEVFKASKAS